MTNRHERRRAKAQRRKLNVGSMVYATTINVVMRDGSTALYWIEVPEDMTNEQAAATQEWHGPFKTDAELYEDQRVTLFGSQCEITEGGMWDPAWDKAQ
jgi:hypothetical protein